MITPEERQRAYERYELYRDARANWEMKAVTNGILYSIGGAIGGFIGISISHFRFWPTVIGIMIGAFAVEGIKTALKALNTHPNSPKLKLEDLDSVKNIDGVWADGNHVRFEMPREQANEIIDKINSEAKEKGLTISIKKIELQSTDEKETSFTTDEGDAETMKSTETGYVNKNNQKNLGKTDEPGSGNFQWFYEMECLNCGHKYKANGHDIWLRKCPKCQGGKP